MHPPSGGAGRFESTMAYRIRLFLPCACLVLLPFLSVRTLHAVASYQILLVNFVALLLVFLYQIATITVLFIVIA